MQVVMVTHGKKAENDDQFVVDKSTDGSDVMNLFDTRISLSKQPVDDVPRRPLTVVVDRLGLSRREQFQRRKTGNLYQQVSRLCEYLFYSTRQQQQTGDDPKVGVT